MFLPNPGILAAGAQERTYADWLAHIAARAPKIINEGDSPGIAFQSLTRVQMGTGSEGSMFGSSWVSSVSEQGAHFIGSAARAIQHGMLTQAAYNAQRASQSIVLLKMYSAWLPQLTGALRNGYVSDSVYEEVFAISIDELSFWDASLKKPITVRPYLNTGPFDYTAAGW